MSEAERYLVLGTAGHIDHGKTTLIKALTGTDCDRLAEERERGITIDIGFASLALPSPAEGEPALRFGIVDVPGHHRFIRNMAAGAAGIDMVLLVVAADDGVMPQTVEHLHIARLLGVKGGLVALNKVDLVDTDTLELALADVDDLIAKSFLAGAPVVPCSAGTGQGLEELKAALAAVARTIPERNLGDRFRMPVDRSFTIKGAGTVVTGTTSAGTVSVDAELQLMPGGRTVRVRGIQVHGQSVRQATPGHRAALNLVGIDKDEIKRGDVLVEPGSITGTFMFDAEVELLPGKFAPLHNGSEALLHIGTIEVAAKLQPLDDTALAPGEHGLTQLRFGSELAVAVGDRFILRHSSGDFTLGGGRVLDAHPMKHRRQRAQAAAALSSLSAEDLATAVLHEVGKARFGCDRASLSKLLNVSPERLAASVADAASRDSGLKEYAEGRIDVLVLPAHLERQAAALETILGAHHASHPLQAKGLSLKELGKALRDQAGEIPPGLLADVVALAEERGLIARSGETYVRPAHSVALSDRDRKAVELIIKRVGEGLAPPQPDEFAGELPVPPKRMRQLLDYMLEQGQLAQAPGGLYFTPYQVELAWKMVLDHFAREETLSVSQAGQLWESSRKYSIPLLQLFEQNGMLVRDGDLRRLKS